MKKVCPEDMNPSLLSSTLILLCFLTECASLNQFSIQKLGFVHNRPLILQFRVSATVPSIQKARVHSGSSKVSSLRKRQFLSMSSKSDSDRNGAWFPIGSAQSLVGDIPVSVEVVGEKLVVWRNGTTWSVMRDACPHRLAPLSQGRVDRTTGCLECPYHGWQFSASGACTRIPQLASEQGRTIGEGASNPTRATAFPVRLTGDLIWAFLSLPPGQVSGLRYCSCCFHEILAAAF